MTHLRHIDAARSAFGGLRRYHRTEDKADTVSSLVDPTLMNIIIDHERCYKIYKQGQGTASSHTGQNRGRRGMTLEFSGTDLQATGHCQTLPATLCTAG